MPPEPPSPNATHRLGSPDGLGLPTTGTIPEHRHRREPFAAGLLTEVCPEIRKVAVLRVSRLGDFLCATPALRALRTALPGAQITLIGLPLVRDLVLRSPSLDCFEPFPGYPGMAEQLFEPESALRFFARMQAERFDLVLQMHGTGVYANPVALMLGADLTAGFIRAGDPPGLLDAAVPMATSGHQIHRLLALTTFLGARPRGWHYDFPLTASDHEVADGLLAHVEQPLIGLHPGSWDATKRWSLERFATVGKELHRRYGGTAILIGGDRERSAADQIQERLGPRCLNLAGRLSLPVLGAVIARLAILITNDSGPAHIAYAMRTASVTIFGAMDPTEWGPLDDRGHAVLAHDVDCRPCSYTECPIGNHCLEHVTIESVLIAAETVLNVDGLSSPS